MKRKDVGSEDDHRHRTHAYVTDRFEILECMYMYGKKSCAYLDIKLNTLV